MKDSTTSTPHAPPFLPAQPLPAAPVQEAGSGRRLSDGTTELIISWLLRIGVWTSITVIFVGLVMLVVTDTSAITHSHSGGLESILHDQLEGQPGVISSYGEEATSVAHGQAFGVIMLGLLILLVTPVLRVAVSIAAFLIERDRLYAVITAVVLALLMVGIFLGRAGG
jgi:uncharacterized membrane protein